VESPALAGTGKHLSKEEHAPEIFNNTSHTVAVDIWSIGHLIRTSGNEASWKDSGGVRTEFLKSLTHNDPLQRPSAAAALDQVMQLELQYQTALQQHGRKYQTRAESGRALKRPRK